MEFQPSGDPIEANMTDVHTPQQIAGKQPLVSAFGVVASPKITGSPKLIQQHQQSERSIPPFQSQLHVQQPQVLLTTPPSVPYSAYPNFHISLNVAPSQGFSAMSNYSHLQEQTIDDGGGGAIMGEEPRPHIDTPNDTVNFEEQNALSNLQEASSMSKLDTLHDASDCPISPAKQMVPIQFPEPSILTRKCQTPQSLWVRAACVVGFILLGIGLLSAIHQSSTFSASIDMHITLPPSLAMATTRPTIQTSTNARPGKGRADGPTLTLRPTSSHIWAIATTATNGGSNATTRMLQYERALPALSLALRHLNHTLIVVEDSEPRSTYLDHIVVEQLKAHLLYTSHHQLITTNKGVKEYADIHSALKYAQSLGGMADDWILKITGRYVVLTPNGVIDALSNSTLDVVARFGSYEFHGPIHERARDDLVSGFFAMRIHVWEDFFIAHPPGENTTDALEWVTARFIQSHVPRDRVLSIQDLNCLIAPGGDDFFHIRR